MRSSQPTLFDPTARYSTSWLLPPAALFFIRVLFALFAWATIIFSFVWDGTHGDRKAYQRFSYFTVLTYFGIAFYGVFSSIHTGTYWLRGRSALQSWPRVLQVLHEVLYSTIVVLPWLVTIVYWALLGPPASDPSSLFTNTAQHALNAGFALIEILLPRTAPLPWWHLAPVILILAAYLGLAYLTHYTQGFYVYSFLDIGKNGSGIVAAYCVGILVGTAIVFVLVRYAIWVRVWVTERKLGMEGGRRTGRAGGERKHEVGMEEYRHHQGV